MKNGLYETENGCFFVCKDEETTALRGIKGEALGAVTGGAPSPFQRESRWIAPLYPANGIWRNKPRNIYFACKNEMLTEGSTSMETIISLINGGKYTIKENWSGSASSVHLEYISELPTSRIKYLSGKFILTLNPPKSDFDVYVKNFGFFNEVPVESVVMFARENHPCWESWLLKNGIPFKEEKIQIGDIVEVTREGKEYATYRELADMLGAKRYKYGESGLKNGTRGRVINIGKHQDFKDAKPVALVDIISEEILIGVDGLRKVS